MKITAILFLFFFQISTLSSQEMISWQELDTKPIIDSCKSKTEDCTLKKIKVHIQQNFNTNILSDTIAKLPISAKIIIDSFGVVKWSRSLTDNKEISSEIENLIITLPKFTAGIKNGHPVNTILDFKMDLNNFKKFPSALSTKDYDVPPLPKKCKTTETPKKCISEYFANYILPRVNTSLLKEESFSASLSFVISENGEINIAKCVGKDDKLNRNIENIITKIKDFIPAQKDGKNVAVTYHMPFFGYTN